MDKVLVTGASGYIASHCIAELLKNGFAVRGSLRNAQRQDEVKNAIKTEADISQLEFCELDLLNDTGWDEAVSGCDYVMHVASPLLTKEPNDENEIIKPAYEGLLRALKSSVKHKVKRFVMTSSFSAVGYCHVKDVFN